MRSVAAAPAMRNSGGGNNQDIRTAQGAHNAIHQATGRPGEGTATPATSLLTVIRRGGAVGLLFTRVRQRMEALRIAGSVYRTVLARAFSRGQDGCRTGPDA